MSTTDLLTLITALLSLLVAAAGTGLSYHRAKASDDTARRALTDAQSARREASEQAAWTAAFEAVMGFAAFDPTTQDVGDRLQTLRIRLTLLVDELDGWTGFDEWVAEEHALGVAYGRQALEQAQPGDSIDERLEKISHLSRWSVAFSSNLRLVKRRGYSADDIRQLFDLARHARLHTYERNNWGEMPTRVPGIEYLDNSA